MLTRTLPPFREAESSRRWAGLPRRKTKQALTGMAHSLPYNCDYDYDYDYDYDDYDYDYDYDCDYDYDD